MKEYYKFTNNPNSVDTRGVFKLFGCFNDQSANEMRKKPENFKFEIGFTVVNYRLYDFTLLSASVYKLQDFKPLTNGIKSLSMYIYRLEEFTPLVTCV